MKNQITEDQSNIYLCVQPVTNVNNSQRTLPKTYGITVRKFSGFSICLASWPWNHLFLKKWQPTNTNFGKEGFRKDFGRLLLRRLFRQTVHKNWKVPDEKFSGALVCWAPTLECWLKQRISSWLWFCYSVSRGLRDCWAAFWTVIAWLACTGTTKLLNIAEDCTCCWILGLSWDDSIEPSLWLPVTLLNLEFFGPAVVRMVTDVARIQCDVKWVDHQAFLLMRPRKLWKVFFFFCQKEHCFTTQRHFR